MNRNSLIPDTKTEPRAKGTTTVQVDTKETNLYENDGGNKNGGGKCLDLKALATFSLCY